MMPPLALLLVSAIVLSGCASSTPDAPSKRTATGMLDDVQRVAVVSSGESKFAVMHGNGDRGRSGGDLGGTVDQIVKQLPYGELLRPIAQIVQSTITSRADSKRAAAAASKIGDIAPRSVIAEAFARTLEASGRFQEVRALDREPVGDDRRRLDAVVRLTLPSWGFVHVKKGAPDLVAGFADVRAQVVLRSTGVVVWEHDEDVTHPGRLPLQSFTADPELARQELIDMLERAGQRLANEFLYARSDSR